GGVGGAARGGALFANRGLPLVAWTLTSCPAEGGKGGLGGDGALDGPSEIRAGDGGLGGGATGGAIDATGGGGVRVEGRPGPVTIDTTLVQTSTALGGKGGQGGNAKYGGARGLGGSGGRRGARGPGGPPPRAPRPR